MKAASVRSAAGLAVTHTKGAVPISAMGAKSVLGSYGNLAYKNLELVNGPLPITPMV